ncbi:E3 SUMO-protein ligase ZBED1-like [Hydra vulgaris]|uniref:E3 SUMO-protein ligase ZBED1-like n=1 Tax=Hydra vulgaris TaxID=6087 RepID=A0ABM4DLW5_HYDVU
MAAATNESNVSVKHLTGKLSKHFVFKLNADGKVDEGDKIYCVHCNKQFAFRGSNTSLTYHLQHKHPLKYQQVVDSERKMTPQTISFTNLFTCQSNKPVSEKVSADLKVVIAHWIASSGRPTVIVEDAGLEAVLRIALQNQTYTLSSRRTIDTVIGEIESYCGITGHWIDSEWKLTSVAIACINVEERHTADNVASFYEEFAATWNIAEKISCIVRNSARNVVAAIGRTDYSHIPCIAHCLQLSILAGLKAADSSPILAKCRHLVRHFKRSSRNTSELKASQASTSNRSDDVKFHKLQQDVATRWNRTYLTLARLLEVKDAIKQHHIDHPENYTGDKLKELDWEKMSKFVSVLVSIYLGPLADATEYTGSEQYATCSAVLPLEAFLRRLLRVNDDDPGYIARFKSATLNDFSGRIENIDALPTLQMAVALDPRYKKLGCLSREKREAVWTILSNAFRVYCNQRQRAERETTTSTSEASEPVRMKMKLTLLVNDSELQSSSDESQTVHGSLAELTRYQEEGVIPETENPLMWWQLNRHHYPNLSSFVQTILCVPATSVPCERLFSSSGYIVNKLRACLLPENVNVLVCLRDWLK